MPFCIYCSQEKSEEEMTLEHIIPQCIGGNFAPSRYKLRCSCKACNNNLGQFVDASFDRDYFVSQWMQGAAFDCYDHSKHSPLPLVCMGVTDCTLPYMGEGEICELYLGPFGETILWIRPHDEALYWYTGGNPRTSKTTPTRAYFFLTERGVRPENQPVLWLSFKHSFKGRKVRKILCIDKNIAIPSALGFVGRDSIDDERISLINNIEFFKNIKCNVSFNINFDVRFMSKLARGVGFSLFGPAVLSGRYAEEISKGIWHRQHSGTDLSIYGAGVFSQMGARDMSFLSRRAAVVLSVMNTGTEMTLDLRLGNLGATIMCVDNDCIPDEIVQRFGWGISLIIYKHLGKCFELPIVNYIEHINGSAPHPGLTEIEKFIDQNDGKFRER